MSRKVTIEYWWGCDKFPKEIPYPLSEALEDSAKERIAEMLKEGYAEGQLYDNVNIDIPDVETPKDGWECSGGWTIKTEDTTNE